MTARSRRAAPDAKRPATRGADLADICEVRVIDAAAVTRVRAALPGADAIASATARLRALGDPTRLRLLLALALADAGRAADGEPGVGELCVCDLALLLGAGQSAVSHSLRALRHLGLVRYRKAGKIAYYRVADAETARLAVAVVGEQVSDASGDVPAVTGLPAPRRRASR